jgi:hypothetical protein
MTLRVPISPGLGCWRLLGKSPKARDLDEDDRFATAPADAKATPQDRPQ